MNCPTCWVAECMPMFKAAPYQAEIMEAIVRERRVAVRGPHGLGKTGIASVVVHWFATTRGLAGTDWKIITTASAWSHLEVHPRPEIHTCASLIDAEVLGRVPTDPRRALMALRVRIQ